MNDEIKKKIEKLENEILLLKGIKKEEKKSYSFGKIRYKQLKNLVDIKKIFNRVIFDKWFNNDIKLNNDVTEFLKNLLDKKGELISSFNEEDLKMQFIAPILNHINFIMMDREIRFFSEESLSYEAKNFIFNGEPDFFIARGLEIPEKPYFFIQEFKRSEKNGNPRPQLLAELISAVELNSWKTIKGAYIVGNYWTFVILEKLGKDKYQYFTSEDFNSAKIDDLKSIYKNLLFIKKEVIKMVDEGI